MSEPSRETRHVRMSKELVDMLSEILEVRPNESSAEYLEPLVRPQIENDHKANLPAIKIMRSAKARAAKARDEKPAMTNSLASEG